MEQKQNILSGYRVIELASVLAGPSVGQFLAELGAEVIKIENPTQGGDVTRSWHLASEDTSNTVSAYFSAANWGKKSMGLDLRIEASRQVLYELVAKSDIIISSYKVGDDAKLGVDFETLKKFNSKLIYGHITGYGTDSKRTGYDAVIQAESGFMFLNGEAAGPAIKMPVALIDILAAHQLKQAILIALIKKIKQQEASYVSVSLFDAAISALANQASNYLQAGHIPKPMGSAHPNIAPYGELYACADGKEILLAIGNDKQFQKLCELLKIEIHQDERFANNAKRVVHRKELDMLLRNAFQKIDDAELFLKEAHQQALPLGKLNSIQDVFEKEDVTNVILKYQDAKIVSKGLKQYIAKDTSLESFHHFPPPPALFAHTREIISNVLHKSESEIDNMMRNKLIY